MNIFVLDENPIIAAQMQCDKHVVKMVTETVQLLSVTMILNGLPAPYKLSHKNHPCAIWARESLDNHQWLWQHGNALGKEYTSRYGKIHKAHILLMEYTSYDIDLPNIGLTSFANCTPYKDEKDVVKAYQIYYRNDKSQFAKWKNGNIPEWFFNSE